MLFPTDKALYLNLNTSFTDFGELLGDLESRAVDACVQLTFTGYSGILLVSGGQVVNGLEETGGQRRSGLAALRGVQARSKERGGSVSAYAVPAALVALLAGSVDAEAIFKNLNSEFTSLDKLVAKLRQDGHTGYVEVVINEARGSGVLFLKDGEFVEAAFSAPGQPDRWSHGAAEAIMRQAAEAGAIFNVYRSSMDEGASLLEAASAEAAPVALSPAPASALAPAASPAAAAREPIEAANTFVNVDAIVRHWSHAFSAAEGIIDGIAHRGTFEAAVREACIELSEEYLFLDPFAGEFTYLEGRVAFDGEPTNELNAACRRVFEEAVARLTFRLKREDLETKIRERIRSASQAWTALPGTATA